MAGVLPVYQRRIVADRSASAPRLSGADPVGEAIGGIGQGIARVGQALDAQQQKEQAENNRAAELLNRTLQAANEAQAQATEIKLRDGLDDLSLEIARGVADGSVPKDKADAEWDERSRKLLDDGVATAPAPSQPAVRAALDVRRDRFARRVITPAVIQRNQTDTAAAIDTTIEYAQRMSQTDPAGAKKMVFETLAGLGPAAGWDAREIQKKGQAYVEGAAWTQGFAAVSRAKLSNKALAGAEQYLATLSDLDPQRRAQLVDRIDTYRHANNQRAELDAARAERQEAARLRKAEAEFNAFSKIADKGGALAPDYVERALKATAGTPYAAAVKASAGFAAATGGIAAAPIAQVQGLLDSIDRQIATGGRSEDLTKKRDAVAKVLAAQQEDYTKDPLRAAAERGVLKGVVPLDMSTPEAMKAGLPARVEQAEMVSTRTGRPVSPLTLEEAAIEGKRIAALPVEQRAAAVVRLSSSMPGPQAQALAKQMDGHNKALARALEVQGAMTSPATNWHGQAIGSGRPVAELILKGDEALKQGTAAPDNAKVEGWKASIARGLAGAVPAESLGGAMRESAHYIAAALASEQGGQADSDTIDRAIGFAVGGSVIDYNGRNTILPAGFDEDKFSERVRTITPRDVVGLSPPAPAPGAAPGAVPDLGKANVLSSGLLMPVDEFLRTLPAAKLVYERPGVYNVLVNERPVLDATGQRRIAVKVAP